jgi:hypothetical protein
MATSLFLEEEKRKIKNEFSIKIIVRIIWPIIPIGMEILIQYLLQMHVSFPNKSFLVLDFIVPVSYLPDYKNEVYIHLLVMCCFISMIPFFCAIVSDAAYILWIGFYLLILFVVCFTVIDYFRYRQKISRLGD